MSDCDQQAKANTKHLKNINLARRREREMFRKRRGVHIKKSNELAQKCAADVYVVLLRQGKYYTYSSTDRLGWPPNETDIVSSRDLYHERDC